MGFATTIADALADFFAAFIASGHAIDLLIAVLLFELLVVKGLFGRKLPLASVLAGLGLVVAWRLAHGGAAWMWIALAMSAAGLAHAFDLWQRWPRPPTP
jgi:hypothetical protein